MIGDMPLDARHLHDALRTVPDPDRGQDLVALNLVRDFKIEGGRIKVSVETKHPGSEAAGALRAAVIKAIQSKAAEVGEKIDDVSVEICEPYTATNQQARAQGNPLPGVKHVIAVGAGKGGVGKSTVAVNLAVGLARQGVRVALLDGDIYGPSAPTMLGLDELPTRAKGQTLLPFEVHGIKAMTMGKLSDPDKALVWRGPMAHRAFNQLVMQTEWGDLDYLIVDLPPGTGDVPLTLAQLLPLAGAVIVCTPQKVAQDDARRAARMFEQLGVPVLGVIENMSYFVGDDGKEYDLFGRGGAETMAETMGLPFLGSLPITPQLRVNSDRGTPLKNWENLTMGRELDAICRKVRSSVEIDAAATAKVPTLTIR